MLFNSLVFIIFAGIFFAVWPFVKSRRTPKFLFLVVSSFVFYGWWDWRFLFLIIASGLLDFFAGWGMVHRPQWRKGYLALSILGNVGSLMVFKYSGFFAENIEVLLSLVGMDVDLVGSIPRFVRILPVGISFYTFQSMSYTIDIYKGQLQPTRNILHFFAYLALFPQLVAGPIIRAADLLPQLEKDSPTTEKDRWEGLYLIVHGFAKKVLIADNLAYYVAEAFNNPVHDPSTGYWWVIITAFAFQIYCDFSGYSDIARGLARWMGYDFMVNFNHPYISTSLREFWSRWHISLSTWFRDYVYIPLGGSHSKGIRSQVNMWITMLVSGFWHGAAWNFIIWGGLHAASTTLERYSRWPRHVCALPGGRFLANFILLVQVWVTWVFFRATSLDQALQIVGSMFSFTPSENGALFSMGGTKLMGIGVIVAIAALREFYFFMGWDKVKFLPESSARAFEVSFLALLVVASVFFRGAGSQFIYFQF